MTMMTCESVRDRLPDLGTGSLRVGTAAAVDRHIDGCPACASELAVVNLVRAGEPALPEGFEARIARAVRAAPHVAPMRRAYPSFAVAASAAFALLAGGLLIRNGSGPLEDLRPGAREVTLGWPAVADPILRATPALNGLTVEELESLLEELES